jgi:4-carboxymuconolactone decarboxylase
MSDEQHSAKNEEVSRNQLRQRGDEIVAHLGHGTIRPRRLHLTSIPGAQAYTREAVFGSVWSRPGLTLRLRLLVTISVLTSLQRLPQLRTYLNSALNVHVAATELREALLQCSVFAGFPTTVNSLELLEEVLEARETVVEAEPVVQVSIEDLDARGRRLQVRLFGPPAAAGEVVIAGALGDAPEALDRIERQFAFGELFQRPDLDLAGRAMCGLAAVVALQRPEDQRRWAAACLRVGVEPAAVGEVVLQTAHYAGFPAAREAMQIVREVVSSHAAANGVDAGLD